MITNETTAVYVNQINTLAEVPLTTNSMLHSIFNDFKEAKTPETPKNSKNSESASEEKEKKVETGETVETGKQTSEIPKDSKSMDHSKNSTPTPESNQIKILVSRNSKSETPNSKDIIHMNSKSLDVSRSSKLETPDSMRSKSETPDMTTSIMTPEPYSHEDTPTDELAMRRFSSLHLT